MEVSQIVLVICISMGLSESRFDSMVITQGTIYQTLLDFSYWKDKDAKKVPYVIGALIICSLRGASIVHGFITTQHRNGNSFTTCVISGGWYKLSENVHIAQNSIPYNLSLRQRGEVTVGRGRLFRCLPNQLSILLFCSYPDDQMFNQCLGNQLFCEKWKSETRIWTQG